MQKQCENRNQNIANPDFDYQGLDQKEVNDLAEELDEEFNIFSIEERQKVIKDFF